MTEAEKEFFDGFTPWRYTDLKTGVTICSGCRKEIDLNVCWCDIARHRHKEVAHTFVPRGCTCGYGKPRSRDQP